MAEATEPRRGRSCRHGLERRVLLRHLLLGGLCLAVVVGEKSGAQTMPWPGDRTRAPMATVLEAPEGPGPEDFPAIGDPPLGREARATDEYDRFLTPGLMNLIVEDPEHLAPANMERTQRLGRQERAGIALPGPDMANFPNSAFTLAKGRMYLEFMPLGLYGPSLQGPEEYNTSFLLRHGLTDNLELRVFSSGFVAQGGQEPTTGFAPLVFDLKMNFWEENLRYHVPAVGLEVFIQTEFGSPAFNSGVQPGLALLLDHSLPLGVNFEHNFAITGFGDAAGRTDYEFGYQWAFQREVADGFFVFLHGYFNETNLPGTPRGRTTPVALNGDATAVGAGGIWNVSRRVTMFGSYNAGLDKLAPTTIGLLGFAVAF